MIAVTTVVVVDEEFVVIGHLFMVVGSGSSCDSVGGW